MSEPISVFDIPLILDMICSRLDSRAIRNCARCSKAWYALFGPYRLQLVRLRRGNAEEKIKFLVDNSHHIRTLDIKPNHFKTFVDTNCRRLRKLRVGIPVEYKAWTGDDSDDPDRDNTMASYINKPMNFYYGNSSAAAQQKGLEAIQKTMERRLYDCDSIVKLLEANPGLRKLYLVYQWKRDHDQSMKSIARPILQAVQRHSSLKRIKLDITMSCFIFAKILNHLPRQLEELEVPPYRVRDGLHEHCDRQSELFKAQQDAAPVYSIRKLLLGGGMECFMGRMLTTLLERCPDLEVLVIPDSKYSRLGDDCYVDMSQVAQVLDSHCPRLHTLNQDFQTLLHTTRITAFQVCDLVRGYTKGFQNLSLGHLGNYYGDHQGLNSGRILRTVLSTATADRLEVLTCNSITDSSEDVIRILKDCPRLRVLRFPEKPYRRALGADLSDLLDSLDDEGWKCWNTLEELEMPLVNKRAVSERKSTKARRHLTAHHTRLLCLRLRTAPKLKSVALKWELKSTWVTQPNMYLTLDEYNESAVKKGTTLLTVQDMQWAGLP